MPRTKARRARPTNLCISKASAESLLSNFNIHVKSKELILNDVYENQIKLMDDERRTLLSIYAQDLDKTIQELRDEVSKENLVPNIMDALSNPKTKSKKSSAASQKDDGYVTDAATTQTTAVRSSRRLSRSLSRSNVKSGIMGPPGQRMKRSRSSSNSQMGPPRSTRPRYRTPMNIRVNGTPQYPPITPKVTPNTPLTLLRRPRQGEMIISLGGSPILVNSINGADDKANCNIPLSDGTVISLLPSKMRESNMNLPFDQMRPETRQELKILHANLSAYLKKKEKSVHLK